MTAAQRPVDLLIAGGTIITMDPCRRVLEGGAVATVADRIVDVGYATDLRAKYHARRVIEADHHLVLPGLIDGHGHAGHGLIKTLGIDYPGEWERVCELVYSRMSDEEFWEVDSLRTALERLKFGVTCGVTYLGGGGAIPGGDMVMRTDDPVYGERHCDAIQLIGIREFLVVGPRHPPFPHSYVSGIGPTRRQKHIFFEDHVSTCETLISRWHNRANGKIRISLMFPVHDPAKGITDRTEQRELENQARVVRDLTRRWGLLFGQDGHTTGTVKFAHEVLGLLGPDALLSHATDLTAEEIGICQRTGTRIVHNPSSIASVLGRCPVVPLLDAGVTVILGSDGPSPDRSCDMFRHMFHCARYHRTLYRDPRILPAGKVLEMVTIDAATALGLQHELGSLEPGKKADLIMVDTLRPHLTPSHMPVHLIVDYVNGNDVDTVVVDGQVLMEDRVVQTINEADVLHRAQSLMDKMLEHAGLKDLLAPPPGFWGKTRC